MPILNTSLFITVAWYSVCDDLFNQAFTGRYFVSNSHYYNKSYDDHLNYLCTCIIALEYISKCRNVASVLIYFMKF